jgi:hypothetical protein
MQRCSRLSISKPFWLPLTVFAAPALALPQAIDEKPLRFRGSKSLCLQAFHRQKNNAAVDECCF